MAYFVHSRWIGFRLLLAFSGGLAIAGIGYSADAAAANKSDSPVELPPFLVEDDKHARPWVYLGFPGHEILSRCSDATTTDYAERQVQLEALIALVLPRQFQFQSVVPKTSILTTKDLVPSAALDVVMGQGAASPRSANGDEDRATDNKRGIHFLPNLALEDVDEWELFAILDEIRDNARTLVYTPVHLDFLLRRSTPALPIWFAAGLRRLFDDMTFEQRDIKCSTFTWISEAASDAVRRDPKAGPPWIPLADVFGLQPRIAGSPAPDNLGQITAEAALFIRWALDDSHRRNVLWEFLAAARKAPVDDDLTKRCFGFSLLELQQSLVAYLPTALSTSFELRLEQEPTMPKLAIHDATPVEVGRILGEWDRLESRYVATRHPEFTSTYLELARRMLNQARRWAPNDPSVCGIVGLLECDVKDDVMARPFLETAVAGRIDRPRVYYELARIRHATALEHPAGSVGRLSADQANSILAPLAFAHRMEPPLVDAYILTGRVWAESRADIQPGNLAVLEDGITLFPTNLRLLFLGTVLEANYGNRERATAYAEQGERMSASPIARDHFATLRAAIAANPHQRFEVTGPEPDESSTTSAAPGDDKGR